MNAQHTLSPWSSPERERIEFNGMRLILAADGVSEIGYVVFDEDARLIAAAPDLLAALREFINGHAEAALSYMRATEGDDSPIAHAITQARAAIAKAEGPHRDPAC